MSQDQGASTNDAVPEIAGQEANAGALQKMKSKLTVMLADSPQLQRIHDIFAGIPRKAKLEAEVPPIVTLRTSSGTDFYTKVFLTVLLGIIVGYLFSVAFGFIFALIDMAGGDCGQETWKIEASEACEQMIVNTFVLSLNLRCFNDKPQDMAQKDFDGVCGDKGSMIGGVAIFVLITAYHIYNQVMTLPVKTNFHSDFFTVESWSGKKFECSYYADVTAAKVSTFGLKITTKAKAKLNAGGADCDEGFWDDSKKGKTLTVQGNSIIVVLAGSGEEKQKFLSTFAQYLPVSIEGSNGVIVASTPPSASLLEGRMQEILDMRKAESNSFKAVRLPYSCDFFVEVAFIVVIFLIGWYIVTRIFAFIDWAVNKGQGKCQDEMRPGVDMCAVGRIFLPVDVPLVNVSDYINLVFAVLGIVAIPTWAIISKAMEYRLHQSKIIQEVLLAGWEWQENKVFFSEDIDSLELQLGSMEKCVKVQAKAFYTISNGIKEPFSIKASFRPKTYKMTIDSGANDHKEKLLSILNEFKPGKLES